MKYDGPLYLKNDGKLVDAGVSYDEVAKLAEAYKEMDTAINVLRQECEYAEVREYISIVRDFSHSKLPESLRKAVEA